MKHSLPETAQGRRELLLNNPAAFYGKSGNILSRLIDRILLIISFSK